MPWVLALVLVLTRCINTPSPSDSESEDGVVIDLTSEEIYARLTQPIYERILREETVVEGADNTQIWLDLYRPESAMDVA